MVTGLEGRFSAVRFATMWLAVAPVFSLTVVIAVVVVTAAVHEAIAI